MSSGLTIFSLTNQKNIYIFIVKREYILQIFHVIVVNILEYFPRDTLNCMDVLYCPKPMAEGNIIHPCNSRYRRKMFLYVDHSRIEYLLYYILNSKIINQNKKNKIIGVSWHTKWDKQQVISSSLTVLIININSTCAVIKIKYRMRTFFTFVVCLQ